MRPRLLPVLASGVLALSLLGPVTAVADDDREVSGPSLPDQASATAREEASDALDAAQAIRDERSPAAADRGDVEGERDATLALNRLARSRPDLSPSERLEADAMFARPTDPRGDPYADYGDAPHTSHCGAVICVHYVTDEDDPNAPDLTDDEDEGAVPESVEQALATAESVHDTYVAADYRRPDGDNLKGPGEDLVDIYLANTGASRVYGYCSTDNTSMFGQRNRAAYCAIDNDFTEFTGNTPLQNQQVTLAHEYFHAVQFAYDYFEDLWVVEATATWAEDELYTGVNDNRQYLKDSQLRRPRVPLDQFGAGLNHYGNWIFFRYLTERWPAKSGGMPRLVRQLWERMSARAGDPDQYSTQAIQSELARRGRSFTTVYGQFADANRRPATTYDEGAAYRTVRPNKTWTLTRSTRSTGAVSRRLDHLTSIPLRFRPGSDLTRSDWRLRLKVDMPPRSSAPVARVSRYLDNGDVQTRTVRVKADGATTRTVGFSASNVDHVELVLINASRRMRACGNWTDFACGGRPRDDGRRTDFRASIFRR